MPFFDTTGDKRMTRQNQPAWDAITRRVDGVAHELPNLRWDILDWGCHNGGLLQTLERALVGEKSYARSFAGVEPDEAARGEAGKLFPSSRFYRDLSEVPEQSVDVFVSHEVLYMVELNWFFDQLKRVLRVGGAAFVALGSHAENQPWLKRKVILDLTHGINSRVHSPMYILETAHKAGFTAFYNQLWPGGAYPEMLRYSPPEPDWKQWDSVEEALEFRRKKYIFEFWPR